MSRFTMPTRSGWSTSASGATNPVLGMIPVAYAPSSVVLDKADNVLIVANDKGIGARYSFETDHGVYRLQHPPGQWHRQHRARAE